jgi:hypothetical protein
MGRTTAVAAGLAGVVAMALLVHAILPWYEVASHPVRLTLQAAVETIDLCWTANGCERFVPKPGSPDDRLAELPPQRRYDVRLHFPNGMPAATKARITIFDTDNGADPQLKEIIVPLLEQTVDIPELAPGGSVAVATIVAPNGGFATAAILFAVLLTLSAGLVLGARSLARPTATSPAPPAPIATIVLVALAATIVHVLLVRSFPIVYYLGADSDDYLLHALNLIDNFRYRISGRDPWNETVRTPGYAVLLAGIFLAFGKQLSTVVLVQGLLFMAAVTCVALALRRWASAALLGALPAIAAIMPPDIEMSRAIQSDGPAATLALFSVAAFIEAACRPESSRRGMMWLGAIAAACAIMVRPTAVVVLVIPGVMALQAIVSAWPTERWRSVHAGVPILWLAAAPAIAALAVWSAYNWLQFRYPGPSNFTQTIRFTGRMDTGIFDLRALDHDERLRRAYLVGREGTGYWQYHVQFVAPISSGRYRKQYVSNINAGLADVVARSDRLNAWQLKAIRLLRGVWWGALLPPAKNYNGYGFQFEVLGWNTTPDAVQSAFPGVVHDTPEPSRLFAGYRDWAPSIYNGIRPVVYLLALIATLLVLCTSSWLLAAPMLVHMTNIFIHAGLGVVYARYIEGLDILLVAQIAIALPALCRLPLIFKTTSSTAGAG